MDRPVVALLTDFGLEDFFVPSLKGVILSLNPKAGLVDISHSVRSFDVRSGAFLLQSCFKVFPAGTVFLAVVDPGVGSGRRILAAQTERHQFIGPDNGLLSMALDASVEKRVWAVENGGYFLAGQGTTFEGRDRMAPLAAWLTLGVPPSEFGPLVTDYVSLPLPRAYIRSGEVIGHVAYIDKFGNVITDIPSAMLSSAPAGAPPAPPRLTVRKKTVGSRRGFYAQGGRREPFIVAGSLGLLEIAVREGSAAALLGAEVGDVVVLQAGG
jgi:hypothetical protein